MKPTHEKLDDLLRRRLGEVPPEFPTADGWERLAERMDHPEDQFIREALSGASVAPVAGWEALAGKLDAPATADMDIAEKLNSLQPTPQAGAWSAFETAMDTRNAEVVDVIVGDQLRTAGTGAPTGWAALAARLELIRERRSCLLAWKVTELSLMASLLLLFVRFGPTDKGITHFPIALAEQDNTEISGQVERNELEALTDIPATTNKKERIHLMPGTTGEKRAYSTSVVAPDLSTGNGDLPLVSVLDQIGPLVTEPFEDVTTEVQIAIQEGSNPAQHTGETSRPAVFRLATEPIAALVRDDRPPHPALNMPPAPRSSEPVLLYLNAFVSPFNFDQVVTDSRQIYDLDVLADSRITRGSSAGLLLDVEQGNSGLQFGAVYSKTSYIPTVLKWYLQETFPLLEPVKGYSRFKYENLEIPFSLSQVIAQNESWRWSARATMSVSLITKSSFYVEDNAVVEAINNIEERSEQVQQSDLVGTARGSTGSGERLRRRLLDPPAGVFQGGSFFDNASFYLGGGVMVERILNPRSSIYVSPSFGRVIYLSTDNAGIGPYQDRLHIGQLRFGVRYQLNGQ